MTYPTVRDLVHHRVQSSAHYLLGDTRTVSVRLAPERVEQLDLLCGTLGYASRQQLMAELLSAAVDDALHETSQALQEDPGAHQVFVNSQIEILDRLAAGESD